MNTKIISTAEPILHLSNQSTIRPTPLKNSCKLISFSSNITQSKISIRNSFGPGKTRSTARIQSLYAPTETTETLYELLGITETGTFSDIKKAYKQMVRKYHPDVSPPDRVDEYTTKFIMVHEAYETLSNPQSKALYDHDLVQGLSFGFSKRTRGKYDEMDKTEEWRMRWHSQVNELKRKNVDSNSQGGRVSWGARMRNKGL